MRLTPNKIVLSEQKMVLDLRVLYGNCEYILAYLREGIQRLSCYGFNLYKPFHSLD